MPEAERFLITERYLSEESEYITDFKMYNMLFEPPISSATYAKIRNRAMTKIALFLNIDTGVEHELPL